MDFYSKGIFETARLLFLALLCFGCTERDILNPSDPEEGADPAFIWTPMIEIQQGDGAATLHLVDPRPFSNYAPPGPSNPEYFNIWIAKDNPENFSLYGKVDASIMSLPFGNLTNGRSYYFFVTSHRGTTTAVAFDTVTTIPSAEQITDVFLRGTGPLVQRVAISVDRDFISYESQGVVYYKAMDATSGTPLERSAHGVSWSPTANRFVYITSTQEGIYVLPHEVKLFDLASGETNTIMEVDHRNYYVSGPSFTPDGQKISVLSSEGNAVKHLYDVWTIDPHTKEKLRVTDFEGAGFYARFGYEWSQSGEAIYVDGWYGVGVYRSSIYKVDLSSGIITPVIQSAWNDRTPSLSPDNSKLAFISDRTGKDELWVYDLVTEQYTQLTGGPSYHFDSRYTNLEWLDSDELLITVYEGSVSGAAKVRVN